MSNPVINFRLTPYQIARGLCLIRKIDQTFRPGSASQIVKVLYLDYVAKTATNQTDTVPAEVLLEVKDMLTTPRAPETNFNAFINSAEADIFINQKAQPKETETDSEINTVTNFSPPSEWLNADDN